MPKEIKIPLVYAENIYKVLENHKRLGFAIVSRKIKDMISEEAHKELVEIMHKYHNANCGPFNRTLKRMIEEVQKDKGV